MTLKEHIESRILDTEGEVSPYVLQCECDLNRTYEDQDLPSVVVWTESTIYFSKFGFLEAIPRHPAGIVTESQEDMLKAIDWYLEEGIATLGQVSVAEALDYWRKTRPEPVSERSSSALEKAKHLLKDPFTSELSLEYYYVLEEIINEN